MRHPSYPLLPASAAPPPAPTPLSPQMKQKDDQRNGMAVWAEICNTHRPSHLFPPLLTPTHLHFAPFCCLPSRLIVFTLHVRGFKFSFKFSHNSFTISPSPSRSMPWTPQTLLFVFRLVLHVFYDVPISIQIKSYNSDPKWILLGAFLSFSESTQTMSVKMIHLYTLTDIRDQSFFWHDIQVSETDRWRGVRGQTP